MRNRKRDGDFVIKLSVFPILHSQFCILHFALLSRFQRTDLHLATLAI